MPGRCLCRNGSVKTAKELELEDSAHGAANFGKKTGAKGATDTPKP
jgi:hypothetical protein